MNNSLRDVRSFMVSNRIVISNDGCPGWCGSVGCVPACEPKASIPGLGHMPMLRARSPVGGAGEAAKH